MDNIAAAIHESESQHMGELRFVVEHGLDLTQLLAGITSQERALGVFSQLRVWDTEHNSGVLIYLLLAERKIEIVADRGIHAAANTALWQSICHEMEKKFRAQKFELGVLEGIATITALLKQHFPVSDCKRNELPDYPLTL
jgi:uncharacterized membrane protein